MNDSGYGYALLITLALGTFIGSCAGTHTMNKEWEAMLVDNPTRVELIKKRILAEKAIQAQHE